jgi:hypothetical protein
MLLLIHLFKYSKLHMWLQLFAELPKVHVVIIPSCFSQFLRYCLLFVPLSVFLFK